MRLAGGCAAAGAVERGLCTAPHRTAAVTAAARSACTAELAQAQGEGPAAWVPSGSAARQEKMGRVWAESGKLQKA